MSDGAGPAVIYISDDDLIDSHESPVPVGALAPTATAGSASTSAPTTATTPKLELTPDELMGLFAQEHGEGDDDDDARVSDGERMQQLDNELDDLDGTIAQLVARQSALRFERTRIATRMEKADAAAEATAARRDWCDPDIFEWSEKVAAARVQVLGPSAAFRHNQLAVINAALSGRDTFVIAPTGGGKSLCYLIPQLVDAQTAKECGDPTPLTLVVSPLLALMYDQVDLDAIIPQLKVTQVRSAGKIEARMLHSEMERSVATEILRDIGSKDGVIQLIFVTPEKLVKSKNLLSKLEKAHGFHRLKRIVIDEAHCCSEWGHDFRPDYHKLNMIKISFGSVPLMCLTATATFQVQRDVKKALGIPGCEVFKSPTVRPNLRYRVESKDKGVVDHIALLIQTSYAGESGIVYALSRKDTETIAAALQVNGVKAAAYTSDCTSTRRQAIQDAWTNNKIQVIVATTAFGLGVNKPDVRFVIHHSIAKSLESYYQESGRAGRDGEPADCVLFYSPQDFIRQANMVCYDHAGTEKLLPMAEYCEDRKICRKQRLAQRFAETVAAEICAGGCDVCAGTAKSQTVVDATESVRGIMEMLGHLESLSERRTLSATAEMWRGTGRKHLKMDRIGKAPKGWSRDDCEHLMVQLVCKKIIGFEYANTAYATNSYAVPGPRHRVVAGADFSFQYTKVGAGVDATPVSSRPTKKART